MKFCGGCNPRHDRKSALERIKASLGGRLAFEYAEEGGRYDMLLYMAGCPVRCTDLDAYAAPFAVTHWEEGQEGRVVAELESNLNGG